MLKLDRYAPFLVHTISNKVVTSASRIYLAQFGIGIAEWRVLAQLSAQQTLSGNRIAAETGMDKSAVSRALQALEARGYVAGVPNGRDMRRRAIGLTPQGELLRKRVSAVALERERQMLHGFSEAERDTLYSLLHRLLANTAMLSGSAQAAAAAAGPGVQAQRDTTGR